MELKQRMFELAVYFDTRKIRVNAETLGLVARNIGQKLTDDPQHLAVIENIVPLKRAGSAYDIAQAVIFLSSKQSAYITSQVLTVDGGLGLSKQFEVSLKLLKLKQIQYKEPIAKLKDGNLRPYFGLFLRRNFAPKWDYSFIRPEFCNYLQRND